LVEPGHTKGAAHTCTMKSVDSSSPSAPPPAGCGGDSSATTLCRMRAAAIAKSSSAAASLPAAESTLAWLASIEATDASSAPLAAETAAWARSKSGAVSQEQEGRWEEEVELTSA
jgi:hypothetical protein